MSLRDDFKKDNKLDEEIMRVVDDVAIITQIIQRMLMIVNVPMIPNEMKIAFSKGLFELKEGIDENYPTTTGDGTSITEMCPICLMSDDTDCPHKNHVRAAIMLMAVFRYHPKVDLDVDKDEIPDPNEGMVAS